MNDPELSLDQQQLVFSTEQDVLSIIQQELVDYVTKIPFDNSAVLLAWLHFADLPEHADLSLDEKYERWNPNSAILATAFGGTNCVGATEIFKDRLAARGIESRIVISPSNSLPEGVTDLDVPFQHAGLIVEIDGHLYFVEPGLGLVQPLPANESLVIMADRLYQAKISENKGEISILKPDGSQIFFDFIYLPDGGGDIEGLVQKPLLRATTSFKIDVFAHDGLKKASLKIDVYNQKITYLVHGNMHAFTFSEVDKMFEDGSFEMFVNQVDHMELEAMVMRIRETVEHQDMIVETWLEGLQEQFYLDNPDKLSPYETSWSKLDERGYKGGGVVVVLLNEKNEVMLYKVPEGKSKPFLNRYAGQLNLFVETADHTQEGNTAADLEDFETNLKRAFVEEIGFELPAEHIYREVDYMPNIRARVAVFKVDSSKVDVVTAHNKARNERMGKEELGASEWVSAKNLEAHWMEPNAKPIIEKLIAEGIIRSADELPAVTPDEL